MTLPIPTLTRKEAAAYLGVHINTLDKLRGAGKLRAVQIGCVVRYRLTALDEFLDRCEDPRTPGPKKRQRPARWRGGSRPKTTGQASAGAQVSREKDGGGLDL